MHGMAGKIIYGINAVSEALRSEGRVNRIFVAKESRAHGVAAVITAAKEARVRFDFVPQAKLNELSGTHEHQGIVAVISPASYTSLDE